MSASNSNVQPGQIVLSPMRVKFDSVDLGGTEGGVTFGVKYELADIMVDQFGKTVLDSVVSGQGYTCKFILAESKLASNWKIAFPHSKLVSGQMVYFDMQTGDHLLPRAKVLILHPLSAVDGDLTQDIKAFKAAARSVSELKYGPDKQVGLSVEMTIFPDTSVSPARFVIYGDPTVGIVNASVAAAVAGANTGNGTIGSEAANNQFTKTETITVQCVGASSGNDFYVSGSLSGPIGEFHLAAAPASVNNFVSNEISFTATQGSTQFVYGDSFTIACTGANYA